MITQEHSVLKRFVLQAGDSSGESTEINACGSILEGLKASKAGTNVSWARWAHSGITDWHKKEMQPMLGGEVFHLLLSLASPMQQHGALQTSISQPETLKASQSSTSTAAKAKPRTYTAALAHTSYRKAQVRKQKNVATLHKTTHRCLSKEARWPLKSQGILS